MTYKAVILDRDGVVNHDSDDYVKSVDEWLPIPGSLEAITRLQQHGIQVFIATNQSGIGRGYFGHDTLLAMHDKCKALLTALGGQQPPVYYCPHEPEDHCDCRKPLPGLLEAILSDYGLSAQECLMVGDSKRDLDASDAIGIKGVLLLTGKGERTLDTSPSITESHLVFDDLNALVSHLLDTDT